LLTVYGHSYCHLCDEMIAALRPFQQALGFELAWVDIEGQEPLEERFGELVPVLMEGDERICHYHLDEAALQQRFNTA
jgi:thioredoxin reductase (NADPH)